MRVDPYSERPLDTLDGQQVQLAMGQSTDPATARTLLDMAGPKFQDWVHKIEDLVEERDFEISKQKVSRSDTLLRFMSQQLTGLISWSTREKSRSTEMFMHTR